MNILLKYILLFSIATIPVQLIAGLKNDNELTTTYLDSSLMFLSKDPQRAQYYLKFAEINMTRDTLGLRKKIYNNYGVSYYFRGMYDSSIHYYRKSIEIIDQTKGKPDLAKTLKNLGISYSKLGLYNEALKVYLEALRIAEEKELTQEIASINSSIGNIHFYNKSVDEAKMFHKKSLKAWQQLSDSIRISKALNNLGSDYSFEEDWETAISFYKKSLLTNPLNDDALKNLGEDYLKLGKLDSAEYYLLQSLSLRRKRKATTDVGKALNQLGELYRQQHKTVEAFNTLKEAGNILSDAGELKALEENVLFRKRLATDNDNYKLALVLADSLYLLEQSVFESERLSVIETQAYYNLKAEQERVLKLEQQNRIITLEKREQRLSLYFTVLVALLILIIASLLWFAYKTSKKKNALLLKHNQLKDAQKAEISHRNKNGYSRIMVLLRSLKKNISDSVVEKDIERVERMVFGLANLESFLYINQETDDAVYVSDFLEDLIPELEDSFSLPDQDIHFDLSISRIALPSEQLTILALLITELTINAFKYAFPDGKGQITIKLSVVENEVSLTFKDDGIGLNQFSQFNQGGFYILENLLKQTNGTYSYDSIPNEGTRFTFTFLIEKNKPENVFV